ncbi:MAG: helix-turn-helix domain-containing protein [Tannerella sp.]|jgi:AraC-like DNA-binding protein|nr:helix-turn-helix domain-containing protein [Tannerella sp.]
MNYVSDDSFGFRHLKVNAGGSINFNSDKNHSLLFLLEGNIHFHTVEIVTRKLTSKEIVLIPKGCVFSHEVRQDSELILFSFKMLRSICDKLFIQQMLNDNETVELLSSIPIRYPLDNFLSTMVLYLDEGLNCEHLHEIKEKELFLILRAFYNKKDLTKLFHEIVGESDFRSLIMHNYMKMKNVGELASLANMGRTTFDCKFKSVFGTSARQWMLNQIAKHVKAKAMDPDITISDLMQEFNFNSATHFNWFCKKQFDCTPLELIRSCRRSLKQDRAGKKKLS